MEGSYKEYYENEVMRIFSELLDAPAPPGREEGIAEIVSNKITEIGYEPWTDPAGNLIVKIGGANSVESTTVIAAHMDELAMVVTRIESDGRLCIRKSGELRPYKIGERTVNILGDGEVLSGVLSLGPGHSPERNKAVSWEEVRVFTGLTPEQLQAAGVRPGSSVVPARDGRGPVIFGDPEDPFVAAWTFDDRMGVATLLRLLDWMKSEKFEPHRPIIIAFTVHEEGGCHGAKVLAQRERPEVFIAVDGCPVTQEAPLRLDGRPGVWSMDSKASYDQVMISIFCGAAEKIGTSLQPAVYSRASSDASAVYEVGAAPRVAFLGHVRENSHGFEIARLSVFENLLKTLQQFIREWR